MNYKLIAIFLTLILFITASSQRPKTPNAPAKPRAARFMVQGTYEETNQGTTDKGSAEGTLIIKYEAARWLTISTNEVGNAFKIRVLINPKLKGKCSLVEVRDGAMATANGCNNATYFFTASSPLQ